MPSISTVKSFKFCYDEPRRELVDIHIVYKTQLERIYGQAIAILKSLWKLKIGAGIGIVVATLIVLPTSPLSLIACVGLGASVGALTLKVCKVMREILWARRSSNDPFFQAPALRLLSGIRLDQAQAVNQILLKVLATLWGKRWQKNSKIDLPKAFQYRYFELFLGTCYGQTQSLLQLLAQHHQKDCKSLLNQMSFDQAIQLQMTHSTRIDLMNWRDVAFREQVFGLEEKNLVKHHKRMAKVNEATAEAFRQENPMGREQQTTVNLMLPNGASKRFQATLVEKMEALVKAHPDKIVAGSVTLDFKKGNRHRFFVQCSGSHLRFYDINGGFFEFPDRALLAAGLARHLQRRSYRNLSRVCFTPYAITPK